MPALGGAHPASVPVLHAVKAAYAQHLTAHLGTQGSSAPWEQVWMPWAHLLVAEAQFRTMMAFLWENMYEPCGFGPQAPPACPIGVPRPPQPPQPERLGVDKSQPVAWQLELNVRCLVGHCEGLNPLAQPCGKGPALGKVSCLLATHASCMLCL